MKFTRIKIGFGANKERKRQKGEAWQSTGTTKTEYQNEIIIPLIYAVNKTVYKRLNIESNVVNMYSILAHKLCGRCLSIFGEWNLEREIFCVTYE